MTKFVKITYGWLASIALLLGFFVSLVFFAAIIVGGEVGNDMALFGRQAMQGGIVIAAIAVAGGLLWMYLTGNHSLTVEKPAKPTGGSSSENRSPEQ